MYFICPGKGSDPFPQTAIKSEKLWIPNWFDATTPHAKKAKTIKGDIQLAAWETIPYPLAAIHVVRPPMIKTTMIHVILLGITSVSFGISKPVGTPTAVADTVIMDPAKKQNNTPLATL